MNNNNPTINDVSMDNDIPTNDDGLMNNDIPINDDVLVQNDTPINNDVPMNSNGLMSGDGLMNNDGGPDDDQPTAVPDNNQQGQDDAAILDIPEAEKSPHVNRDEPNGVAALDPSQRVDDDGNGEPPADREPPERNNDLDHRPPPHSLDPASIPESDSATRKRRRDAESEQDVDRDQDETAAYQEGMAAAQERIDALFAERDALRDENNTLRTERDQANTVREEIMVDRDDATNLRNAMAEERDEAVADRNAFLAERDGLTDERDAERDRAHAAEAQTVLMAVDRDNMIQAAANYEAEAFTERERRVRANAQLAGARRAVRRRNWLLGGFVTVASAYWAWCIYNAPEFAYIRRRREEVYGRR